jgi:cytochrome c551
MSRNDAFIGIAAFVLIVFSLVVSIVIPRRDPGFPGRSIGVFVAVAASLVVLTLASVEIFGESHSSEGEEAGHESTPSETTGGGGGGGGGQGDAAAGKEIFVANCGSCHTREEAGTEGNIGPVLDDVSVDFDGVVQQVTNGGGGMPAFQGTLSEQQIQDVAAFVVASEG